MRVAVRTTQDYPSHTTIETILVVHNCMIQLIPPLKTLSDRANNCFSMPAPNLLDYYF